MLDPKNFGSKKVRSKKVLVQKKLQKRSKIFLGSKQFWVKNVWSTNFGTKKKFRFENNLGPANICVPKEVGSKKYLGPS